MLTVAKCWECLEAQVGASNLPKGATNDTIEIAEAAFGLKLPDDFRRLLMRHDGSGPYFISPYKIGGGGQSLLPLKRIVRQWKWKTEVAADMEKGGDVGAQFGPIKRYYWNSKWIPFTDNECGDHIYMDLDPPKKGTLGQIVDWSHEGAVSKIQSPGIRDWLNEVVREIKKGVYRFADTM